MFKGPDKVGTVELCRVVLDRSQWVPEDDGIDALEVGDGAGKEGVADQNGRRVVEVGVGGQSEALPLVALNVVATLVKVLAAQRLVGVGAAHQKLVRIVLRKQQQKRETCNYILHIQSKLS